MHWVSGRGSDRQLRPAMPTQETLKGNGRAELLAVWKFCLSPELALWRGPKFKLRP